ncbi:unnamed protein product [Bursaphelenchus okinawaensis]|uniref:Uncharacterized protein n=1 Tax=Bursaphelenchus okinawaensis TaxID=465554 RepID=A0A811LQW0_9BILA|nr:unnamed protein product [Bursaphelenchus okinawaensis]CAG9127896.1 unnamed protein product [Bursaphelenchus okinawaensis]
MLQLECPSKGKEVAYWGAFREGKQIDCEDVMDVDAINIITCPKDSSFQCYQQQAIMLFAGQKDLEMICYNKDNIEVMKTSIKMSLATECPMVNECENIEYPSPFCQCDYIKDSCERSISFNHKYTAIASVIVVFQALVYFAFYIRRTFVIPGWKDTKMVNSSPVYTPVQTVNYPFVEVLNTQNIERLLNPPINSATLEIRNGRSNVLQ